jgi:hypothetical protein
MTIGIAIVIAMVLYLIDRNKVWKQAAKILGGLILLAVLGGAGVVGWVMYDNWRTARKEAAEQAAQAATEAALKQNGIHLAAGMTISQTVSGLSRMTV